MFQTFNLLAALTVTENVELPMRILGSLKDQEIKQRCKDILTRVGLHERMLHLVIILPLNLLNFSLASFLEVSNKECMILNHICVISDLIGLLLELWAIHQKFYFSMSLQAI